jgi:hypothetical protein
MNVTSLVEDADINASGHPELDAIPVEALDARFGADIFEIPGLACPNSDKTRTQGHQHLRTWSAR